MVIDADDDNNDQCDVKIFEGLICGMADRRAGLDHDHNSGDRGLRVFSTSLNSLGFRDNLR